MFCSNCRTPNNENEKFCIKCGVGLLATNQPFQGQPIWSSQEMNNNYLPKEPNTQSGGYAYQETNPNPPNGSYAYQEKMPNTPNAGYPYQEGMPNTPNAGYTYQEGMPTTPNAGYPYQEAIPTSPSGYYAYQEVMSNPKNNKKKVIGIIVGISGILAVMIALGIFFIMRTTYIEVPDFAELTKEEATVLIEESRLVLGDINERYSRTVDEGLVISQSPRAGREVEHGERIDLVISLGTQPDEVSDSTDLVTIPDSIEYEQPDYNGSEQPDYNEPDQPDDSIEFDGNVARESASPFNLDVWGVGNIITLKYNDMPLDVPIHPRLDSIEDLIICDTDCCLNFIACESRTFPTPIFVGIRDIPDNLTFSQVAEAEIAFFGLEQSETGFFTDIDTTLYHLSEGELAAGIRLYGYQENGELISGFLLYKFNEYNGYMIMTLLSLETDAANRVVISDEFALAYGVWRYIDAGFLM